MHLPPLPSSLFPNIPYEGLQIINVFRLTQKCPTTLEDFQLEKIRTHKLLPEGFFFQQVSTKRRGISLAKCPGQEDANVRKKVVAVQWLVLGSTCSTSQAPCLPSCFHLPQHTSQEKYTHSTFPCHSQGDQYSLSCQSGICYHKSLGLSL